MKFNMIFQPLRFYDIHTQKWDHKKDRIILFALLNRKKKISLVKIISFYLKF